MQCITFKFSFIVLLICENLPTTMSLRGAKRRGNLLVQPIDKYQHDSSLYREIATSGKALLAMTQNPEDFVCGGSKLPPYNALSKQSDKSQFI